MPAIPPQTPDAPGRPDAAAGNRLRDELSPYLLQHAHNPVDWYPWGEAAFARARAEDKPIFLSIGYATCHWCHVMERESFEDPALAALLNAAFINVKVDREERPDVDRIYMSFVQATSGHGGWPLSVWLTPALEPFVGGTYFPPEARHGQIGLRQAIVQVQRAWREQRRELEANAAFVLGELTRYAQVEADAGPLNEALFDEGIRALIESYDVQAAGFGLGPKFPRPANLELLARGFARSGDRQLAQMLLATLQAMARGGIYDHLAGGFHRYAVDRFWHVPHFEKMLYDQAQLLRCYLVGHQLSGEAALAQIARDTAGYVAAALTDGATGAFYSAEDADSLPADGGRAREGAYYVWQAGELRRLLGEDAAAFAAHYGVTEAGNADDPHGELRGHNVLHEQRDLTTTAARLGLAPEALLATLAEGRQRLRAARALRPRPQRDDKVLCGWNGLMISALARAAASLGDANALRAAQRAATFLAETLWQPAQGRLLRRYRAGVAGCTAQLDDYVFAAEGLLDLYQSSLELRWLQLADTLCARAVALFFDEAAGGFFSSVEGAPDLLLRLKDDHDGAEPAGSSVACSLLLRLHALLDRPAWHARAERSLRYFSGHLRQAPSALPLLLVALDTLLHPPCTVVLVGEREEPELQALLAVLRRGWRPNTELLLADEALREAYGAARPALVAMQRLGGRATAYVCHDHRCAAPTADPEQLERLLPTPLTAR
ncbi:MAG: thioredoxin domain-containing protein [Proteobacteria bacterium]|nr:thioredoxin domain-containing protein [Pseudomonadota bacterium]